MALKSFEGVVENGLIRLPEDVHLPEHARVYVVVPEPLRIVAGQITTPRLAHSADATDFVKTVLPEVADA